MARPIKQGLEYFSFDTDFFTDIKVRKIARACGPNATSILICLLCNIYKNEGYYILWDEDLPFVIADTVGVAEGSVTEVIKKAIQVNFFDKEMCDTYHILTSSGIQKRFFTATYQRKEINIDDRFLINHTNNRVNHTNNSVNCIESTQSKVKGKKIKEINKEIPSPCLEISLDKCYKSLMENRQWLETLTMNLRSSGHASLQISDVQNYLISFFRKLANEGSTAKAPKDAMAHFSRWLTIELKNGAAKEHEVQPQQLTEQRNEENQSRRQRYKERESYAVTLDQMNKLKTLMAAGDSTANDILNGRVKMNKTEITNFLNTASL